MLTIAETPLHFGLLALLSALSLILVLMGIYAFVKSEKKDRQGFSFFLAGFFAFFTFLILTMMIYNLPAVSTAEQLLPYYLGAWMAVSMFGFFIIFHQFDSKIYNEQRWLMYLPFIGTLSFLVILWIITTPTSVILVSDGVMTWLSMPPIVMGYGGVLALFYFVLVPFYTVYKVNQVPENPFKTWNWLALVGLILWFIAAMMMVLVLYLAAYMLMALTLAAIAIIIELIAWIGIFRVSTS
ncbi:MAG: hypothetical protein ACFFCH_06855 [Promethearchaeota archaeon]